MMLKRVENWEQALHVALESHLARPFEWGVSDCSTMAADAVLAVTGEDLLPVRDWTSRESAAEAAKARGGLAAAVNAVLPPVGVLSAQRGDIGLWRQGLVSALVVCTGAGFVGKTVNGRLHVARSAVLMAWASGR